MAWRGTTVNPITAVKAAVIQERKMTDRLKLVFAMVETPTLFSLETSSLALLLDACRITIANAHSIFVIATIARSHSVLLVPDRPRTSRRRWWFMMRGSVRIIRLLMGNRKGFLLSKRGFARHKDRRRWINGATLLRASGQSWGDRFQNRCLWRHL